MKSEIDGNGWPIVPHPVNADTIASQVKRFFLIQFVFSLIVPTFVASSIFKGKLRLSDLGTIYKAVVEAHRNPINKKLPEYQDKELIRQLWKKDSAKPYIEGDALEYQTREGYCNSTTIRCTLKSFPSYPREKIPPQKSEASDPEKWQGMDAWGEANEDGGDQKSANLEIIPGSCSYAEFLSAVKRGLEDPSCRVVLNYLRPVLFGFAGPRWLPAYMCISLLGGHFSPIVGMIETEKYNGDNPLIGVFDVNHKYGGAYLVPAKSLYRSVELMDVSNQKPRAMILVHEPNSKVKGVR